MTTKLCEVRWPRAYTQAVGSPTGEQLKEKPMFLNLSVPLATTLAAAVLAVSTAPAQPEVSTTPAQPELRAPAESQVPCAGCGPQITITFNTCPCTPILQIFNPQSGGCTGTSPVCAVGGGCSATVGLGWPVTCMSLGAQNFFNPCFGSGHTLGWLCPTGAMCPCTGAGGVRVTLTCTPCM